MIHNESGLSPDMVPDTTVNVRDVFGINQDLEVPAFSERTDYVPAVDDDYRFDHDTTMAILAGHQPSHPSSAWPFLPASRTTDG